MTTSFAVVEDLQTVGRTGTEGECAAGRYGVRRTFFELYRGQRQWAVSPGTMLRDLRVKPRNRFRLPWLARRRDDGRCSRATKNGSGMA